jgi:hypothetical protein
MHSHETGELSVHFGGELEPQVSWNPPGMVHGGATGGRALGQELATLLQSAATGTGTDADARIAEQLGRLLGAPQVEEWLQNLMRPEPKPRVLVDILFPPFKTTIEDPKLERRTVTGQWYD